MRDKSSLLLNGLRDYGHDRQIGLEDTPDMWVSRLVGVFREVRRVLRDDGTLWVEIGSSFVSSGNGSNRARQRPNAPAYGNDDTGLQDSREPGSAYLDLCDECLAWIRSRRDRTDGSDPLPPQDEQPSSPTDRDNAHSDYALKPPADVARDAPASTIPSGARVPRAELRCDVCGVQTEQPPIRLPLDAHDAQPSARISPSHTPSRAALSRTSAGRSVGMEPSGLAWGDYTSTLRAKDLLPQPWVLGMALQMDGWILRSEIVWFRPNPMPESVTDRPTKAHSTVLLFAKRSPYFYDADAIREAWTSGRDDMREKGVRTGLAYLQQGTVASNHPTLGDLPPESPRGPDGRRVTTVKGTDASEQHRDGERWPNPAGANARSVWQIPTEPTPFAHFATWPQKLVARMIQAGTSEKGCCPECGAPWVRETEIARPSEQTRRQAHLVRAQGEGSPNGMGGTASTTFGTAGPSITTLGWSPSCDCGEYVCPACDNDLEHGSRTTPLSDVPDAIRTEGPSREAALLLSGMREPGQDQADADVDMRGVRADVLAQDRIHAPGTVLLQDVRQPDDGPEPALDQGVCDRPERVQIDPRPRASDGEPRGLRDGTPAGNGDPPGPDADTGRGSPSPERGEGRQSAGESSGDSEAVSRSAAEGTASDDHLSPLRRADRDEQRCPQCDGALELRPSNPVPATVLDVFAGSGTTLKVARDHGRHAIGIELNEDYCRIAADRLAQQSLLTGAAS